MIRTYQDWQADARSTTKSTTQLGNELRDRWDDWKQDAPYDKWEDCILAELGITAKAWRKRNERERPSLSATKGHTETRPPLSPPKRRPGGGKPSLPAEVERRRVHVRQLRHDGWAWNSICEAVGISDGTLRTDLVVLGLEGRRSAMPSMQQKAAKPEGDFRWRNKDLGIPDEESIIEQPSIAACETPSADEAIEDVRMQLALILGGRYQLSLKDRNNLIAILNNALERLHNNDNQSQGSQGTSRRNRVAG